MFTFNLKHNIPEVEKILDELLDAPFVYLPKNPITKRIFGIYTKPLKDAKLLKTYHTPPADISKNGYESIAILKINNFWKPNNVIKQNGKQIKYLFKDTLIPKIPIL